MRTLVFTLIILTAFIFSACSRYSSLLHDHEYLLDKNVIKSDNKHVGYEDLKPFLKQKPNRKMFGLFRFYVGVYSMADKWKKNRKFKLWLKNTVGEAPVILDTMLVKNSARQFKLFLNGKGYFNSEVKYDIKYIKKKAKVYYSIHTSEPFIISSFNYNILDSNVRKFVLDDSQNSLIHVGNNFDMDILEKERNRLVEMLKNNGYYAFSKEYIGFQADSLAHKNKISLIMKINSPVVALKDFPDSLINVNHQRFIIRNIYINPDYTSTQSVNTKYDTLSVFVKKRNSSNISGTYFFLYKNINHLEIKPKIIARSVFIENSAYYNLVDVQQSYNALSDLRNFRFINFEFDMPKKNDSLMRLPAPIDCRIQMTRIAKQSISLETEGTNSGGNLGIAGNLIYQNKNIFRGAEIFNLTLKGAMEVQSIETQTKDNVSKALPFNTVEAGIMCGFKIPKFLVPIKQERFSKYFRPKTTIATGFDYELRPDYTRYIANITFGYDWKESKYIRHILNPVDLSYVKISKDSVFNATIQLLNDMRIKNAYTDHMTPAASYSFIFNNQEINKLKDFMFFRLNAELAGNMLQLLNNTFQSKKFDDGSYHLFNVRYAQYFRFDADIRFYKIFNEKNKLVLRLKGGAGFPFTNLDALPFEKSFYAGGANSIRAWRLRQIGPGSFKDTTNSIVEKTGDIDLEGNLEYRFPIYKAFQGAAFLDAGNVWLRKKNPDFPGGEFNVNRFLSEIAVGFGLGLRMDFKFFIIRLDAAVPVRDPSMDKTHRWVLNNTGLDKLNFNIGIGYPF